MKRISKANARRILFELNHCKCGGKIHFSCIVREEIKKMAKIKTGNIPIRAITSKAS